MGKLDRLIKSVASLDAEEQKAILKALDVYGDDQPVETVEPVVEEEKVPVVDTPTAAPTPAVVVETPVAAPQGSSNDIFAALQAQLNEVMTELKGLKETKQVLEVEKKEFEEKLAKQPFGLHGKVQTKESSDSTIDVEKMYSQNLKRY